MRVAALFSGAGGLDLGFKKAGFDVVWANEYDKTIWETFEKNHPETKLDRRSIRNIPNEELPQNIDGLIGGPPCQSWSLAGAMRGIEDDRGSLFYEYIRVLSHLKPKFFLAENVKGIVSSAHKQSFEHILHLFDEAGYTCHYEVLNACDYGVPQTRERVFIIGFRKDINVNFKFPKPVKDKVFLNSVIKGLEDAVPHKKGATLNTKLPNNEYLTGSFSTIFMSRNRRRAIDEHSFTIQAGGRHAPIHPLSPPMVKVDTDKFEFEGDYNRVRRLSVRECARIQTFPDDFIFYYSNVNDGYKMIGNAVPVELAKHIADSIKIALSSLPKKEQKKLDKEYNSTLFEAV
ncbi:MAG: DNA cytosine methyltransferase [Sulfuricurvum sp.]|nr:DNA cytosine methyltransferase [Sulfuricurvum sp.]